MLTFIYYKCISAKCRSFSRLVSTDVLSCFVPSGVCCYCHWIIYDHFTSTPTALTSVDDSRSSVNIFAETNAIVHWDGTVQWMTSSLLKSSCKVDVTMYPFDEQTCHFKFGSWTYNVKQLDMFCANDTALTDNMVGNGEWTLESTTCNRSGAKHYCKQFQLFKKRGPWTLTAAWWLYSNTNVPSEHFFKQVHWMAPKINL